MIQNVYIKNYGCSAPAPPSEGWSRPLWWLEQPTIGDENVVWELMTVFAGNQNPYTHNLQASGGVTTEFYADKDDPTPFYTATANNNTLIDFDDCNTITGQFARQCWVKSFPTNPASNWSRVDFVTAHTVYGNYSSQIVERLISCKTGHTSIPSLYHSMGIDTSKSNMLESIEYRNVFPFANLAYWLWDTPILQNITLENPLTFTGNLREAFYNCGLTDFPKNLTLAPNNTYSAFTNSKISVLNVDFDNSLTFGIEFNNCRSNVIVCVNMENTNVSVGNFTYVGLYYLELNGYTLGHSLNGNAMKGEEVFTAWVDSLGNANGAQTITVSTLQFNSFGGIGSYVDNELFAKGYTLNVV